MREAFKERTFRAESLEVIDLVIGILDDYAAQGYTLTLRQVYYQLVARGHVPNSLESYKRIGDLVNEGRLAGLIDWSRIEDRARETVTPAHWTSAAEIAEAAAKQYRVDHWADQPWHVEILVEKQALEGVLEPVAKRWDLPFTANKGYLSQSMVYQIAKRLGDCHDNGQEIRLLYLGDHDPSGLDMDRDLGDRLRLFTRDEVRIEVVRLALVMDQIEQYRPPENPAKITDSRAEAYIARHGASSWELDALEPKIMVSLVDAAVEEVIDRDRWDEAEERQAAGRKQLRAFAAQVRGGNPEDEEG
jgi:hypothetical protein